MPYSNRVSLITSFLLVFAFLLSCEGPAGPEGPQGPQGTEGPQGPQGPEGNANVMADTLTLTNSDWEEGRIVFQTGSNSTLSRSARVGTLSVPEITQDVEDFGIVLVYLKTHEEFSGEPNVWNELPYSILAFGSSFSYNFTYSYKAGEIKLYYYYEPNSSDSSTPNVNDAEIPDYQFKYIVAPGNAVSAMKEQGIETKNHDQVVNFLSENYSNLKNNVLLEN